MNKLIVIVTLLISFSAKAEIVECKFDDAIEKIVKKIGSYTDCKQAIDDYGSIAGYRVIKPDSSIYIAYANDSTFLPSHLNNSNNVRVSLLELFNSTYTKGSQPLNSYTKAQKILISEVAQYGVIYKGKQTAFSSLET